MAISDRKARERMERERLILQHADDLLSIHGYHGLNLDELAERVEYSKATIYNHFESKEDLMSAVDLVHLKLRAELFGRALIFDGSTRERMFVVGWADRIVSLNYPHWSSLHQLLLSPSIFEKINENRRFSIQKTSNRCFSVAIEIIQQAVACGDLPDRAQSSPPQIMSGLLSLSKGAHLLHESSFFFPEESGIKPLEMHFQNCHLYLDGLQWKELSTEFDYTKTDERIKNEVFFEELQKSSNK